MAEPVKLLRIKKQDEKRKLVSEYERKVVQVCANRY